MNPLTETLIEKKEKPQDAKKKGRKIMIIAVGNRKGGTGKTTITLNVGVGLAKRGYKVLLVDGDPQGSLTRYMEWDEEGLTIDDILLYRQSARASRQPSASECIHHSDTMNLDYIPSTPVLTTVNVSMSLKRDNYQELSKILKSSDFDGYDYILIDSAPADNALLSAILYASDKLLISAMPAEEAKKGIDDMVECYKGIKERATNDTISDILLGIVFTNCKRRNNDKIIYEKCCETYPDSPFREMLIPESKNVVECEYQRKSVLNRNPKTNASIKIMEIVDQIIEQTTTAAAV